MREYSNYCACSNMPIIPSRDDGYGPHTSSWTTLNWLCDLPAIGEIPHLRSG
jgi:hypothetical protein